MKKMTFFILTLFIILTIGLQTTFAQDTLEGHTDDGQCQCRFRRMVQLLASGS